MSAVMELTEPEGLGAELLIEWGQIMRDDPEHRYSWSVKPRLDRAYHGDPPERVRFVDRLIAQHRLTHHDHWSVVARRYLSDLAVWQIAKGMKWSEGRVLAVLHHVSGLVEREFHSVEKGRCRFTPKPSPSSSIR